MFQRLELGTNAETVADWYEIDFPQCRGLFTCSSIKRITPLLHPVIMKVPTQPITSNSSYEISFPVEYDMILEGETWPA